MNTYCVKYFDVEGNVCIANVSAANRIAAFHTFVSVYENSDLGEVEVISIVRVED